MSTRPATPVTVTGIATHEPSGRIAMWLRANPGQHLDRAAAAGRLQVAIGAVDPLLAPGVEAGLLTVFSDGNFGRAWRAGPRLQFWDPLIGSASSVVAPIKPAPAQPRKARVLMPVLDPAKLTTVLGGPPSRMLADKGGTKYDPVLASLTADGMGKTGIAKHYSGALLKAASTYLAARPALRATSRFVVRRTDADHCGIWRMARADSGNKA